VNEGHRYFIGVLEKALNALGPLAMSDVGRNPTAVTTNVDHPNSTDAMANKFHILSIEDTEVMTDAQNEWVSPIVAKKPTPTHRAYEFRHTDEEVYFTLFCFFDDLADVREYLTIIWTRYRGGDIDLVSAAIITNTAFELVQRAEKELISTFPLLDDYEKAAGVVYILMCLLRGEDPDYREQPDDVVNLNMLDIAEFLYLPVYSTLCSFCDVIQEGCLPVYKPGYYGTYDPLKPRSGLTPREQLRGSHSSPRNSS
jgi:hypothetical protein